MSSDEQVRIHNLVLEPGVILQDRYELRHSLGRGGFGVVYKALDTSLERPVAMKFLKIDTEEFGDKSHVDRALARFRREAKLAARISHPNIVNIFDYGILSASEAVPFIVMEFVPGHDLDDEIARRGPLKAERLLPMFVDCLGGLGEAHERDIVHKDLTPQNLLLFRPQTRNESLRIFDFGVSHVQTSTTDERAARLTATGQMTGTMQYLPPEYIESQTVTPAFDVYQMGLILVEGLSGRPAVQRDNAFQYIFAHSEGELDVPDALWQSPLGDVLERALALDHEARFPNALEFAGALDTIEPATMPEPQALEPSTTSNPSPISRGEGSSTRAHTDTEPGLGKSSNTSKRDDASEVETESLEGESPREMALETTASPFTTASETSGNEPFHPQKADASDDGLETSDRERESTQSPDERQASLHSDNSTDRASRSRREPPRGEEPDEAFEDDMTGRARVWLYTGLGSFLVITLGLALGGSVIWWTSSDSSRAVTSSPDVSTSSRDTSQAGGSPSKHVSRDAKADVSPSATAFDGGSSRDALSDSDSVRVRITTEPDGARLFRDGTFLGRAPQSLNVDRPDDAKGGRVRTELSGYEVRRRQITRSDAPRVHFELEPVSSPPPSAAEEASTSTRSEDVAPSESNRVSGRPDDTESPHEQQQLVSVRVQTRPANAELHIKRAGADTSEQFVRLGTAPDTIHFEHGDITSVVIRAEKSGYSSRVRSVAASDAPVATIELEPTPSSSPESERPTQDEHEEGFVLPE